MENRLLYLVLLNAFIAAWLMIITVTLLDLTWIKVHKFDKNKQRSKKIRHLLKNQNIYRMILRILLLSNLSMMSIIAFILIQKHYFSLSISLIYSVLIMLSFAIVVEILGNGALIFYRSSFLKLSIPLLSSSCTFLHPIVVMISSLQKKFYLLSKGRYPEEEATTADEIKSLVEKDAQEVVDHATLEASERKMIKGIFDLEDTIVKEIMTPRVDIDALKFPASMEEAKRMIIKSGHSRIPVYKDRIDEVIGVIYAKDLLDEGKINSITSLEELLHQPFFVPETKNISDLLEEFQQNKHHIAIIIDEYGGISGIVTFEDILEEIVGEIQDEYDVDEEYPQYTWDNDTLIADARVSIEQVNEVMQLSIHKGEDYDTIGGYITSELGRIPKPMEHISLKDITVQILEADDRTIRKLKLNKVTMTESSSITLP